MEKLKIEKRCEDIVTFDGKALNEEWLLRNNLTKISFNKDKDIIILQSYDLELKFNEKEFEEYLSNHK